MLRLHAILLAVLLKMTLAAAAAEPAMQATAPEKMMPPAEKQRLDVCNKRAAAQHIRMDARAKFLMDCMKEVAR